MRKLLTVWIVLTLCLLPVLTAAAQEATAEATVDATAVPAAPAEAAPTGLGTLMLLVGLGAVALVGLTAVARDNLRSKSGSGT